MLKITGIVLTRGNVDLSSIKDNLSFCDEILTVENKFLYDFSKVRNLSIVKAKNEWILFVDDDETLSPGLIGEINDLNLNNSRYEGFYINRKNYFITKFVGTDKIVRLAKKKSGKWVRAVHETWDIKGMVGKLNNPIIHNTSNSVSDMINKINLYSSVHSKENLKEKKESTVLKIMFFPVLKFFESLIIGRGFIFSLLQSFHSFLSWSKEWELQKN